jgi:hypothetical protein
MVICDNMIHSLYHWPVRGIYFSTIAKKYKMFDVSYEITLVRGKFNVHLVEHFNHNQTFFSPGNITNSSAVFDCSERRHQNLSYHG